MSRDEDTRRQSQASGHRLSHSGHRRVTQTSSDVVKRRAPLADGGVHLHGGALPDGSTATPGEELTSEVMRLGDYTQPAATNGFMFTLGGGVQVPVAPHVSVDVGYRMSRIDADTPVNAHSIIAAVGYRF